MRVIKNIMLGASVFAGTLLVKGQESFIWELNKEGQEKSYVFVNTRTCGENQLLPKVEKEILPRVENIFVELSEKSSSELGTKAGITHKDQRLKSILPFSEYQKVLAFAREKTGMSEQMVNMYKPFYVNAFLMSINNPCGQSRGEKVENTLQQYAEKNKKPMGELLSTDEMINIWDKGSKEYWSENIIYTFNKNDDLRQSVVDKNRFYDSGNMSDTRKFLKNNDYFSLRKSEEISKEYTNQLLPRLEDKVKKGASLFVIDLNYADDVYIGLVKKGYLVKDVKL